MNFYKLAFIGTASIILCACNSESSKIEQPKRQTSYDWCIQEVKNNLKDPDSANFKDVLASKEAGLCKGLVNAKNAMGGYAGFQKFDWLKDGSVWFRE